MQKKNRNYILYINILKIEYREQEKEKKNSL